VKSLISCLITAAVFAGCPCFAASSKESQADLLTVALPVSAYWLTLSKDDEHGAWSLARSLGLTAIATLAINSVIDKDSPNGRADDAFPSGHTAIAFSSAAFIQKRYGWRTGIGAYAVSSYVGWLRTETDDHDNIDVIGGAALGIVSSYLFTRAFDSEVRASAWAEGDTVGIYVEGRF
jgi:membrane-associated phospholipid phosphatase